MSWAWAGVRGSGIAEERKRGNPCRELRGLSPGPRAPRGDLKRVDLHVSVALGLTAVVGSRCAQRPVRTAEPEPGAEPDTREVVQARGDQFWKCSAFACRAEAAERAALLRSSSAVSAGDWACWEREARVSGGPGRGGQGPFRGRQERLGRRLSADCA